MLSDFKAFIAKGNVMQLAVAVIIGGAFATIVKSLTDSVIMPIVGAIFGDVDFSDKYIVLGGEVEAGMSLDAAREAGANVLVRYTTKVMEQFEKKEEEEAAAPEPEGPTEIELLTEIRDALNK